MIRSLDHCTRNLFLISSGENRASFGPLDFSSTNHPRLNGTKFVGAHQCSILRKTVRVCSQFVRRSRHEQREKSWRAIAPRVVHFVFFSGQNLLVQRGQFCVQRPNQIYEYIAMSHFSLRNRVSKGLSRIPPLNANWQGRPALSQRRRLHRLAGGGVGLGAV